MKLRQSEVCGVAKFAESYGPCCCETWGELKSVVLWNLGEIRFVVM